jgi:uncharacterized protein YlxP (DUF503 family)
MGLSVPRSSLTGAPRALPFPYCFGYTPRMIVSMMQILFEIPDVESIKDKRRIIRSIKDRLTNRFHLSAAEVDLQDSLTFAQIGGALVSNSRIFGETVLNKAFKMIEDEMPIRIQDIQIHSEEF